MSEINQETLDAAVAKAIADTNAARDTAEAGLLANRDALKAEKTVVETTLKTTAQNYAAFKDAQAVELAQAEQAKLLQTQDFEMIGADIKKKFLDAHALEVSTLKEANEALTKTAYDNTTSTLLGSLVNKLNVGSVHIPAVKAFIATQGLAHAEGTLTIGGQTTEQWQTSFLASEYGQNVVVPPESSGGGSLGGGSNGTSTSAHDKVLAYAMAGSSAAYGVQPDK